MRKFWFAYLAKALVIFPGGFGTLDETLRDPDPGADPEAGQEDPGRASMAASTWDAVLDVEPLVEWGAIEERDLALLRRVDTTDEAFEALKEHLTRHHIVPATRQETRAPGIAKTRG